MEHVNYLKLAEEYNISLTDVVCGDPLKPGPVPGFV